MLESFGASCQQAARGAEAWSQEQNKAQEQNANSSHERFTRIYATSDPAVVRLLLTAAEWSMPQRYASRADEARRELELHLAANERNGRCSTWNDIARTMATASRSLRKPYALSS